MVFAQPVSFEHFTVDEGLPDNTVRALVQDDQGFLWIGTQAGLVRFDGYEMRTFLPDPADSNSIGCRIINRLFLDSEGDLWIGSIANGVSRYSSQTGRFTNFSPQGEGPAGTLPGTMVVGFAEESDGSILVVFRDSGSLARINPRTLAVQNIPLPPDLDAVFLCAQVDDKGLIWSGTIDGGVVVRTPDGRIVERIGVEQGLQDLIIVGITPDLEGRRWFLGKSSLSLYDERTGKVTFFTPRDQGRSPGNLRFMEMDLAPNGMIWIAADVGLYRFSQADGSFTLLTHDPGRWDSLANGPVISLCRDKSEILWAGSWHAGLNKLDPQARKFSTFIAGESRDKPTLPNASVSSVLVDKRRRLWVGTGILSQTGSAGGLVKLDSRSGSFQPFDFPVETVRTVLNIAETNVDSLWLGTNVGLWLCLPGEEVIVRPPHLHPAMEALQTEVVRALARDQKGHLWVGTPLGGLYEFDPSTGQGRQFTHDPNDDTSLSMNSVTCVLEDSQGRIWVGTDLGGLNLLDRATGQFQRFYDARVGLVNVSDIVDTGDGALWLASVAGLLKFDTRQGTITALGAKQGLPTGMVSSILPDEEGHLWLSTDHGLVEFDPRSGVVRQFDIRDGLPSNGACFARHRAPDGTLYFGGPQGLVYFHPRQVKIQNAFEPSVVLTDVEVLDRFQKPVQIEELTVAWNLKGELSLPWNHSDLVIRFASLDFSRPERIKYRYMLENHDHTWREPGLERKAQYSHLSPGQYRFRVQATNGDGVWSPDEAVLPLKIGRPWWTTPWAWIGYGLLALALVWAAYRLALRREKRRADLGIRLAEGRKIRELDAVKSRFFANISHEFRTPLTLIQGPLSRLEQDPSSGDSALFSMMRRNTLRLGQLINQLFDLSRLENKRFPLNWQPLDAIGLLKVLSASFDSLAKSRGLTYRSSFPDHSAAGLADADLLEKVVGNLLSNAIRYAPLGAEVWLKVGMGQTREPDPQMEGLHPPKVREYRDLIIAVGNTGTFIPAEERDRIFERFYQSPATSEGRRQGSGIGLALIRELVDLVGGRIELESEPDQGTVFTVVLPLFATETPAPMDHAGTVAREAASFGVTMATDSSVEIRDEQVAGAAPLLLVVEDDPDLRTYIFDVLKATFRVVLACDGDEGLEAAFTEVPDLVISDVMMPRRDGFQLCAALKKDNRTNHIPVILLTARAGSESRLKGLKTGADIYLAKPFEPDILLAQVRNLIEQRRFLQARFAQSALQGKDLGEGEPSRDDLFLQQAREIVIQGISDSEFTVARFSREVGMSRSQLHRKLTALTGMSASAFVRSVRLHRAAELLRSGYGNVTEVALETGHQSLSNFSKNFREQFGISPSRYLTGDPLDEKKMEGRS